MTARKVVLVVDDDPRLVKNIQDYLELQGFVVFTANDGIQAHPRAVARKPSVIILDVDMPMTNGLKALNMLREDPATQNIPVILMTGMATGEVAPSVASEPRLSHVKKPIEPEDLMSLVRHYIPNSDE